MCLDLDSAKGAYQEWEIEAATQLSKSADGAFTVRDKDGPGAGMKALADAHAGAEAEGGVGDAAARGRVPVVRFGSKKLVCVDGHPVEPDKVGDDDEPVNDLGDEKGAAKVAPMTSTSLALLERRLPCHVVSEDAIGGALPSSGQTRCGLYSVVKVTPTRVVGSARGDCHPRSLGSLLGPGVCERCERILVSRPDHFDVCTCCFRGLCPDCGSTCIFCFGCYCRGFCRCGCQIDPPPVEAQQSATPIAYVAVPVEAPHHVLPVEAHHHAVPLIDVHQDPRDSLTYLAAPVTSAVALVSPAVVDDSTANGPIPDAAVEVLGPTEYAERQYACMSPDEREERVRRTRAGNARDILGDFGTTSLGGADRDAAGVEEFRYEEVSSERQRRAGVPLGDDDFVTPILPQKQSKGGRPNAGTVAGKGGGKK